VAAWTDSTAGWSDEDFRHLDGVSQVAVHFRFAAEALDPQAITSRLGIEPDWAQRRGDPIVRSSGEALGEVENGIWSLTSVGRVRSLNIVAHLEALLALLRPVASAVAELAAEYPAFFFMVYTSDELPRGRGFGLSPPLLGEIAALGAAIDLDFYCDDTHVEPLA
jgi:hypothetical protein